MIPVLQLSIRAGDAIMEVYEGEDFQIERKADYSPLTLADRRAHEVIDAGLTALDNVPVLSEEGRDIPWEERRHWDELWLVDPLDGTREFIKRNGEFTVNIALVQKGEPVLGVIYAPARGVAYVGTYVGTYVRMVESTHGVASNPGPGGEGSAVDTSGASANPTAASGRPAGASFPGPGAFRFALDGAAAGDHGAGDLSARAEPIRSAAPGNGRISIIASRSHMGPRTQAFIRAVTAPYDQVERVHIGSALKLCLLAEGSANIYPRYAPTMEWDTAAGHAILRAAGGEIWQAGRMRRQKRHGGAATGDDPASRDDPFRGNGRPLVYNKPDLRNPHFVARGW